MRFRFTLIIITVLAFLLPVDGFALGLSAHSAVVINTVTGDVVYEKSAYTTMPMASTTKIMTAICAIENGDLDGMVKVHPSAVGVEGSSMYLGHGEELTLRDLLYGLMLSSGNDAAVAIAVHISGGVDEFANLMNETAKKIGAKDTCFANPNGLDDDNHYTTAYDLAMITRYGMSLPEFAEIVSSKTAKVPWQGRDYPRTLNNHNKLLNMYEGCDGVKTGFTKKSGRCLVSSATREGYQVIAVTLNAPNDWNDHMAMLDYAFANYENKTVISADDYLCTVPVVNGNVDSVRLCAAEGFSLPVPNGTTPKIEMKFDIPRQLDAPVGFDQKIGKVDIYYNGSLIKTVDAVSCGSASYVEPKNFFTSMKKILMALVALGRPIC
ncbi:MAG: D-alanyl-D-alanine carboxypeptidase [Clostridia bacterium]|nr:D-alanyl-D-alanine carboxypeptidase [Clostridia bacterium]